MEKKKVSIYTIAKLLNVSPATVSYVVTGRYNKMSLETRQKILDEIERTGYVGTASRSELDKRRYEGYSIHLKEYRLEIENFVYNLIIKNDLTTPIGASSIF